MSDGDEDRYAWLELVSKTWSKDQLRKLIREEIAATKVEENSQP